MRTRNEIAAELRKVADQGRKLNGLQNEGRDGYDHMHYDRLHTLQAELDAAIVAEWTPAVTAERRAAWNTAARSGRYRTPAQIAEATGINHTELVAAVRRHSM